MAERTDWFRRGGAVAGILAPLLWLAATMGAPGDTPSEDATGDEVVSYFSSHGVQFRVVSLALGLSLVGLLWFAAALRDKMGQAEGGNAPATALAFGGWLVFIALDFVALVIYPGLLASDAFLTNADSELVRTWYLVVRGIEPGLWEVVAVASTFVLVPTFAATSFEIHRRGVLPTWIGWFGVLVMVGFVAAALEVLGGRIREVVGIFGYLTYFLLFRVWLVAAGVGLFLRDLRAQRASASNPRPG